MAQEVEVNQSSPVVFERGGEVRTTSRDVANLFGKEHRNVLRDIDVLIKDTGEAGGGSLIFEHTP
ncbi:Rha family transcriptional regulator, partial [Staphylococcus aureus]|nr:Rha family transcriptional regulator [Staphylococcus aureus]